MVALHTQTLLKWVVLAYMEVFHDVVVAGLRMGVGQEAVHLLREELVG